VVGGLRIIASHPSHRKQVFYAALSALGIRDGLDVGGLG